MALTAIGMTPVAAAAMTPSRMVKAMGARVV